MSKQQIWLHRSSLSLHAQASTAAMLNGKLKAVSVYFYEHYTKGRGFEFSVRAMPGATQKEHNSPIYGKSKTGVGIIKKLERLLGCEIYFKEAVDAPGFTLQKYSDIFGLDLTGRFSHEMRYKMLQKDAIPFDFDNVKQANEAPQLALF